MKIDVRKKILNLAVASAVGVAGLASIPAHAINVSQNGLGQILIFPYYTVKNGNDTVFTVTNTSDRTVTAKVRWRESLNSREVRDFNVILSPHDVWTAAVTASTSGGALVRTYDKTCTAPVLPASATATGATEVAFTSLAYDGSDSAFNYDGGGKGIGRTQEGYFEVIEMASSNIAEAAIAAANVIEYNSQHVNGVPRNCGTVSTASQSAANMGVPPAAGPFSTWNPPQNVLKGGMSIINVATGTAVDAEPTVIANWNTNNPVMYIPGDLGPTFEDGDDDGAGTVNPVVISDLTGAAITYGPFAGTDGVTVLLQGTNVINEFSTSGSAVATDWVITFPTKHFYVDSLAAIPAVALPPFTNPFDGNSCDAYSITAYNREEYTPGASTSDLFSPAPSPGGPASLCYESNVLTFNGGNVLGTGDNHVSLDTLSSATPRASGWANLSFTGAAAVGAIVAGVDGLPFVGFAVTTRTNSAEAGNNRNYGTTQAHSKVRSD